MDGHTPIRIEANNAADDPAKHRGIGGGDPHHAETKAVAARSAADLARLAEGFVSLLPEPPR